MKHYRILDVDENASMKEVKRAYENKVNKFKEDIKDEIILKKFIKTFDKAYEEIKAERQANQNEETVLMNAKQVDSKEYLKSSFDRGNRSKYDDFEDYEEEVLVSREKKKSSSKNTSTKNKNSKKKKSSKNINKDKAEEKCNRDNTRKKVVKEENKASWIQLPLKILAVPVIAILSVIIFLLTIVNLLSWIASKLMIIGSIAISAIHGYQIYLGQAAEYKVFILSALAFTIALFLPSILKPAISMLSKLNNKLKRFVF